MSATLQLFVFAGAAATAVAVIVLTVGPHWRRIARLALGRVEQPTDDHWRRVHLEADRRPPFGTRGSR